MCVAGLQEAIAPVPVGVEMNTSALTKGELVSMGCGVSPPLFGVCWFGVTGSPD